MPKRPSLQVGDVVKFSKSHWSVNRKSSRFDVNTTMIVVRLSKADSSDGFCNVKVNVLLSGGKKITGYSTTFARWELWKTGYNVNGEQGFAQTVPTITIFGLTKEQLAKNSKVKPCVCATEVWMNLGCKCGAFQKEMLNKAKGK